MERLSCFGLTALLALALVATSPGCGHEPEVRETPELPPQRDEPEDMSLAAWATRLVRPGEPFRLTDEPLGVEGPDVVLSLARVDWTVFENPDGSESRSGTVSLVVRHGNYIEQVTISEGDERTVFDARIEVLDAGLVVSGSERQHVYAELRVTAVD